MNKFPEAFCNSIDENISAQNLFEIEQNDPCQYVSVYRGRLVCPRCKKAPVSLVHDVTPFFRSYPGAKHLAGCDLVQDHDRTAKGKSSGEETKDRDKIKHRLSWVFEQLLDGKNEKLGDPDCLDYDKSEIKRRDIGTQEKNTIAQKSLRSRFISADFQVHKVFYGNVFASWEDTDNDSGKWLHIETPDRSRTICQIKVTNKVAMFLKPHILRTTDEVCKIAFYGMINKRGNACVCVLEHSDFLELIKSG